MIEKFRRARSLAVPGLVAMGLVIGTNYYQYTQSNQRAEAEQAAKTQILRRQEFSAALFDPAQDSLTCRLHSDDTVTTIEAGWARDRLTSTMLQASIAKGLCNIK